MSPGVLGVITAATCGDACWRAHEVACRCSCGGSNHGILRQAGAAQPVRTARIGGSLYELVGVLSVSPEDGSWSVTSRRWSEASAAVIRDRFPGLDVWAYGAFRAEALLPVLDRKISGAQARWPEVVAVAGARRLLWARPRGTPYQIRKSREVK